MDNIEMSIRNLIKTTNGLYKSEKQKTFLLSQTVGREYCVSGNSFKRHWTDVFVLDDKGVVSLTRHQQSGKTDEKWNRDGTADEQIKNAKAIIRHNKKIDAHNAITVDAEKYFIRLCLAEFGYVVCPEMKEKCWNAISISENKSIINVLYEETNMHMVNDNLTAEQLKSLNELAGVYVENINIRDEWRDMYMEFANKYLDIRCKVYDAYPTKLVYTFM